MQKKHKLEGIGVPLFESPSFDQISRVARLGKDPLANFFDSPVFRMFDRMNNITKGIERMRGVTKPFELVRNPFAAGVPRFGGGESAPHLEPNGANLKP